LIVDKPWGVVQTYALNQPASVRVITVAPGEASEEHTHRLRDKLWVVLDPGLRISVAGQASEVLPGAEIMVPSEEPHQIENLGSAAGRVLEIAFGYTTEEDTFPVTAHDQAARQDVEAHAQD
jgi:mannose-6-phosphate isomerase-like protein (cupin superfamily)